MVPITIIWKWILNTDYGLLNWFLTLFGIQKLAWLTTPNLALIVVIAIMIWKNIGYNVLIYLVGLRGIPKSYYEAAALDGATSGQCFRHISLPLPPEKSVRPQLPANSVSPEKSASPQRRHTEPGV